MVTTEPAKKSGLEVLKAQSEVNRIIFVLNMLHDLHKTNTEKAGGQIATTRAHADAKIFAKGKAQAYKDVATFIAQIFEDEVKGKMAEQKSVIVQ